MVIAGRANALQTEYGAILTDSVVVDYTWRSNYTSATTHFEYPEDETEINGLALPLGDELPLDGDVQHAGRTPEPMGGFLRDRTTDPVDVHANELKDFKTLARVPALRFMSNELAEPLPGMGNEEWEKAVRARPEHDEKKKRWRGDTEDEFEEYERSVI